MGKLEIVSVGSIHSRRRGCSCPDMATSSCVVRNTLQNKDLGLRAGDRRQWGKCVFDSDSEYEETDDG